MYYGYEEPIAMPTMGVYDTSMMRMYMGALKNQYDETKKDFDEFIKNYGPLSFSSPIAEDNAAYDRETLGKIRLLQSWADSKGVDLLRSAEGRAAVNRLIAGINRSELANIKQSAENAKEFIKTRQRLLMEGKWSPELENEILGGKSLENWNTSKDGIWNYTSLPEYKNLNQLTQSFVDNIQSSDLTGIESPSPFKKWVGVSDETLSNILPAIKQELGNTANGRLFIKQAAQQALALDPEASQEKLESDTNSILTNMIRSAHAERLNARLVDDDAAYKQANLDLKKAELLQQKDQFDINVKLKNRELDLKEEGKEAPVGFTQRTIENSRNKANSLNPSVLNQMNTISNEFSRLSDILAKDGGSSVINGKRYTADQIRKMSKYYSKYSDYETNEKSREKLIKDGLITKDGQITDKFKNRYARAEQLVGSDITFNKSKNDVDVVNSNGASMKKYNERTLLNPGGGMAVGLMQLFTGTKAPVSQGQRDTSDKTWKISLNSGNWNFTQVRASHVSGRKGNSELKKLQSYLKKNNVEGMIYDESAITSYGAFYGNSGNDQIDVSANVTVNLKQLDGYFSKLGITNNEEKIRHLRTLGLKTKLGIANSLGGDNDKQASVSDFYRNKMAPTNTLYIEMPITKTFDNNGYEFAQIDDIMNASQFTASKAYDNSYSNQVNSITNNKF